MKKSPACTLSARSASTSPTIVVFEAERVALLELDEFALIGRQEDATHKA